jgi:hypothetical protein
MSIPAQKAEAYKKVKTTLCLLLGSEYETYDPTIVSDVCNRAFISDQIARCRGF